MKKSIDEIESQIINEQKSVKFDIREFTMEYYYDKYSKDLVTEENELYVPDYQREFVWDETRQSQFIESLILGLPVPLLFVAENEYDVILLDLIMPKKDGVSVLEELKNS